VITYMEAMLAIYIPFWPHYSGIEDLVCENVNTIGGNFGTILSKADKNGDAITKLAETNKKWFHATRTTSFLASGSWTTVTYDSLRYGNVNNGMVDIATGIFNVQVPGDYEFHYQGRDDSGSGKYSWMRLMKDGVVMSVSIGDDEGINHNIFGTAILKLQAGQKVWVETYYTLWSTSAFPMIHFTGSMVNMA